jgi:hypothetical protein
MSTSVTSSESSYVQSVFLAVNVRASMKKQCIFWLFVVVITFVRLFIRLQPTYTERKLVVSFEEDIFSNGSATPNKRTTGVNNDAEWKLCRRLMQNDYRTYQQLKNSSALKGNWFPTADSSYVRFATDCNYFRRQFGYSMSLEDITVEERRFPLAFRFENHVIV